MTRLIPAVSLMASILLALTGCASRAPEPMADVSNKSAALADRFQPELQGYLQAAMKAGGPVGALGVCQQVAPAIAAVLA